jgi:hypothetical protein
MRCFWIFLSNGGKEGKGGVEKWLFVRFGYGSLLLLVASFLSFCLSSAQSKSIKWFFRNLKVYSFFSEFDGTCRETSRPREKEKRRRERRT